VVPQGLFEFFPIFFFGDFQSLFSVIFFESFWGFYLGDLLGGCMHEPFMVLFTLILLPNP
jgi:hypothetical protein